jgi:hypothetical protein
MNTDAPPIEEMEIVTYRVGRLEIFKDYCGTWQIREGHGGIWTLNERSHWHTPEEALAQWKQHTGRNPSGPYL